MRRTLRSLAAVVAALTIAGGLAACATAAPVGHRRPATPLPSRSRSAH